MCRERDAIEEMAFIFFSVVCVTLAYIVSLEIWEYGILDLKLTEQNMTGKEHIKNKQKAK